MKAPPTALRVLPLVAALACALALPHAPRSSARQNDARGFGVVHIKAEDGREVKLYDKSFALVVGVSDYTAGWPKLPGVRRDIEEVSRALELHGFQVTKVENPDSVQLDKAFRAFIDEHGLGVENRLLFYFAGHGHTVKQSYGDEMGYVVPTDAPNPNRDRAGFMSKAMDMQQIELYARRVQSKHALFVFDSCFSGALFALSRAVPDSISYKTARPVRQFITSGSADEQVPDQSIFRRQFVEALEGEADLNRDGYVTGTELGEFLQDKVINYSRNSQHPQYGKIRNPKLDKGDFVFALPKPPPAGVASSPTRPPHAPPPTSTPAPPPPADRAQQEFALWSSVRASNDPKDFQRYLEKYPQGVYAEIARRRVASLTPAATPTPAAKATPTPAHAVLSFESDRPSLDAPAFSWPERVTETTPVKIELVFVPPGSFFMGSERSIYGDEKPAHMVRFSAGFHMGKYEVTRGQWWAVMGRGVLDMPDPLSPPDDDYPVDFVSWDRAQEFIRRLNNMGGDYFYRLPSEAEWEYACRAGTTGDYAGDLDSLAWYVNNSGSQYMQTGEFIGLFLNDKWLAEYGNSAHPVGKKQPNAFGLHDMHGNVWEWCEDRYHRNYKGAPTDGSAWVKGGDSKLRISRGGSWASPAPALRSAHRSYGPPSVGAGLGGNGFRVVAVLRPSWLPGPR